MTTREEIQAREQELRRRWHQSHVDAFLDTDPEAISWRERRLTPHAAEARVFLEELQRTRDLNAFQLATDRWVRSFDSGYAGTGGQMIINQINKRSPDPETSVAVLLDVLKTPRDVEDAVRKIRSLAQHLQDIRVGAHPSPKRAPFVASYYWGLDDPASWPVAWPRTMAYLEYCTGIREHADQGDRYADLYEFAMSIDGDPLRFERVTEWWHTTRPLIINEVLCDRAALREGAKERGDDPTLYTANAQALVVAAGHIGTQLAARVSEAAGRELKAHKPPVMWSHTWPRGDLWADWRVPSAAGLGLRLWLNSSGVAIGLRPSLGDTAVSTEAAINALRSLDLPEYEVLAGGRSSFGRDVGFLGGRSGEALYARWFDRKELNSIDIPSEVLRAAQDFAPTIAQLMDGDEHLAPASAVEDASSQEVEPDTDPLAELADELLVDPAFITDIVALLEDKRQVVFYGPPGTGKTFFARKLAEALVADAERRPIVQFHPSTSYEDFFEGYRPETDAKGTMSYRLRRGPLADLAARASAAPAHRHLMIIDEINRANLPKVLGELLFLFEYRDTPVRTLYRPDDPFEMPQNVWFIGTMNTADRSIALVDAALRRRFHFIPFFPNHGPMAGLLDRWLERENEPAWVGDLVSQVNDELTLALGGPHLQLGASHFMKWHLDVDSLRRIWQYDIEPFIEDQFFGDAARIESFRFDQVLARFRDLAGESMSEEPPGADLEG